jgi:hypothetical protein
LDFVAATVLWPLLETPMQLQQMQTRWLALYPRDWQTGQPADVQTIASQLSELLLMLEQYLYVLIISP